MNDLARINASLAFERGMSAAVGQRHEPAGSPHGGEFSSGRVSGGTITTRSEAPRTAKMSRKELIAHGRANGYTGTTSHSVSELRRRVDAHMASRSGPAYGEREPTRPPVPVHPATSPVTRPGVRPTGGPSERARSILKAPDRSATGDAFRLGADDATEQALAGSGIKLKDGSNFLQTRSDGKKRLTISKGIGYDRDVDATVAYDLHSVNGAPTATRSDGTGTWTDHEYVPGSGGSAYQSDAAKATVLMDKAVRSHLMRNGFAVAGDPLRLEHVRDRAL